MKHSLKQLIFLISFSKLKKEVETSLPHFSIVVDKVCWFLISMKSLDKLTSRPENQRSRRLVGWMLLFIIVIVGTQGDE